MRGKTLAQLYADLDIMASFSRPQISNDNPYSESQFKTMKYCPEFPDRFDDLNEARAFFRRFFNWYNDQHRHSGLNYLTPNQVHTGAAAVVVAARQVVLDAAHARHPDRFIQRPPRALPPPSAVYINQPDSNVSFPKTAPGHSLRADPRFPAKEPEINARTDEGESA